MLLRKFYCFGLLLFYGSVSKFELLKCWFICFFIIVFFGYLDKDIKFLIFGDFESMFLCFFSFWSNKCVFCNNLSGLNMCNLLFCGYYDSDFFYNKSDVDDMIFVKFIENGWVCFLLNCSVGDVVFFVKNFEKELMLNL